MPRYELHINGRVESIEAPEDMPLLWVLRDRLGLHGTKYGCGIAQCRACTVHVDGIESFSCMLKISDVGSAEVTTIEGLESGKRDRLVGAWVEEDVPQCGYCQVGQIMTAAALLERTPRPTDDDIDAAMVNICRCGTYNGIRRAIHRAAKKS